MNNSIEAFENVFWLGGSPCAGKSSISELLCGRYDMDIYRVDDAFETHAQGFDSVLHPTLTRWLASSWNERWMRPPEALVNDVIACYQEHFGLILKDVCSLPKNRPLLVEGSALLPSQVAGVITNQNRAIWIVPTVAFQNEHYSQRQWILEILAQCTNPEIAFQNWMARDAAFASWVTEEASSRGLKVLKVDGSLTIEQSAIAVADHFKFLCI